jgi:hypothetical protein
MPEPIPAAVPPQAPAPATNPAQAPAPVKPASQTPPAQPSGASQQPPAAAPTVVPITALHEEREKRQQLQAQLDAMKKVMANNVLFDAQGNPVMQQQQPQAQPQAYQQEMDKLWETDPRRAVQAEIMTAMTWRDMVDAQIEQQATGVSERNPDFYTFRPEVMTYLRTLPIDQRNRPGMVEAAYYFIKGQKVDNIMAKTKQEWEAENLRKMQAGEFAQGMPSGAISAPAAPQGQVTLTEDQKKAAAAFGITEADYVKFMKR